MPRGEHRVEKSVLLIAKSAHSKRTLGIGMKLVRKPTAALSTLSRIHPRVEENVHPNSRQPVLKPADSNCGMEVLFPSMTLWQIVKLREQLNSIRPEIREKRAASRQTAKFQLATAMGGTLGERRRVQHKRSKSQTSKERGAKSSTVEMREIDLPVCRYVGEELYPLESEEW